jgi:hypothetical protein
MPLFDPLWASDDQAPITTPSADQIEAGFSCGEADPGLFNWLFQNIQSTINALNIGDMASKFRLLNTTEGIAGGGNLEADRTLRLDFPGLQPISDIANDDLIAVFDSSVGAHRYATRSEFTAGLGGGEGGGITAGANIGTGAGQSYSGLSGTELRFRSIADGDGINVSTVGDTIVIALADMGSQLTFA